MLSWGISVAFLWLERDKTFSNSPTKVQTVNTIPAISYASYASQLRQLCFFHPQFKPKEFPWNHIYEIPWILGNECCATWIYNISKTQQFKSHALHITSYLYRVKKNNIYRCFIVAIICFTAEQRFWKRFSCIQSWQSVRCII